MGDIINEAASVYRDMTAPGSGVAHEPVKSEIRGLFGTVERAIDAVETTAALGVRWTPNTIRVRAQGNVVIASALENGDALDGLTLVTGQHVFLGSQTAPAENGIYTVVASGPAPRATFADTAAELSGIGLLISEGTDAGKRYTLSMEAADITVGSTALNFSPIGSDPSLITVGDNTFAGSDAMADNVSGIANTAFGKEALRDNLGDSNTAVGDGALKENTTGEGSVAIGVAAARGNLTGDNNVVIGTGAGLLRTSGDESVIIGASAVSGSATGGDAIVAVGYGALTNYTGSEATAVGHNALVQATGIRSTAFGTVAGGSLTTGSSCSYFGFSAGANGSQKVDAINSMALGANSFNTLDNQVVLGDAGIEDVWACASMMYRAYPTPRTYFFGNAGNRSTSNNGTVGIGDSALINAATVTNGVFIGDLAGQNITGGNGVTAVGARALNLATTLTDTTMFGNLAGRAMLTGVGATCVGFRAAEYATASRNITALGDSAFWLYQGAGGVALGYRTAEYTTDGDASVYIGRATGVNRADGDNCVFVGSEAGGFHNVSPDPVTGVGAVAAGDNVIGIGYRAMSLTTGDDHTGVGHQAGLSLTGGNDSTFLGANAGNSGSQKVDAVNSMALGANTHTTADNQVVIGDSAVTEFVLAGVTVTKADLIALLALI